MLTDVMGHAGLAGYAVAGMILFILACAAIVAWIYWPGRRREMDEAARLPLEDDGATNPRTGATR
jgi:cbb3-type cytochrome oxidase subunit 3